MTSNQEEVRIIDKIGKPFRTSTSFGLCYKVNPDSNLATLLLQILEPIIEHCDMPDCNHKAVRVGIFSVPSNLTNSDIAEFRGLCDRHRQFGIWDSYDTPWGFSS